MSSNQGVLDKIKGGLIVSCQALKDEPLYSSYIMSRMAYAAQLGGACGIRANTAEDITAIMETVKLPIIGLFKKDYADSEIYITPTMAEVDALISCHPDIIAIDATNRPRPNNETLEGFFTKVRNKYPDQLFMADCSCFEDGLMAEKLGFDLVGTTLSGYTRETKGASLPNYELISRLCKALRVPVIAEGGISSPEQLKKAMDLGIHAAVVGSAITRPMEITKRYVGALK